MDNFFKKKKKFLYLITPHELLTEKLPLKVAVWMPIAIIFIFSTVGIIHANQK